MAWRRLGAGIIGGRIKRLKRDVHQYLGEKDQHSKNLFLWAGNEQLARPEEPIAPYPLILHNQVQSYQHLPVIGGLLDQPTELWLLINAAGNAEAEWHAIQRKAAETFKQ